MRVFGHRRRLAVAKIPYSCVCVDGVPIDYHIDMGTPFYVSQPYRPNPVVFTGNVPIQPPKTVRIVTARRGIGPTWYGITPLSYLRG